MHTFDLRKIQEVFERLRENVERLTPWEIDRLEEWETKWKTTKSLTERQLEILEEMYLKIP